MDSHAEDFQQTQSRPRKPRSSTKQAESSVTPAVRAAVFKLPKRKRLACDPCHKSKRRCDGTAPCSNCYFASKECTYTDAAGRPVPPPHEVRRDIFPSQPDMGGQRPTTINLSTPVSATATYQTPESVRPVLESQHSETLSGFIDPPGPYSIGNCCPESPAHSSLSGTSRHENSHRIDMPQGHLPPRKRLKDDNESGHKRLDRASAVNSQDVLASAREGIVTSTGFEYRIVHELVNLFFAHCHPHRLIIHSASFYADLCRGRVPAYLLNAVCAVAAPLSLNPLVRTAPVRKSGEKFANAALAQLFDAENRVTTSGIEAAQAMALVQTYIVYNEGSYRGDLRLYGLALEILHSLRSAEPNSSTAENTPLSSDELFARTVRRESERRTFWLIHMVELLGAVFTHCPTMYNQDDLAGVRLPCDEESFDLAIQTPAEQAEYLDTPALRTRSTSQFGHVIRIATILLDIENNNMEVSDPHLISKCEQKLEQWVMDLADHLRYNPENLRAHLSLWETGANAGTWCYCFMHILHACAILALSSVRRHIGQPDHRDHESALQAIPSIITALGLRARNSILMGSVLWVQYCGPHASRYFQSRPEFHDSNGGSSNVPSEAREAVPAASQSVTGVLPQVFYWIKEWEEFWGPATVHRPNIVPEADVEEHQVAHTSRMTMPSSRVPEAESRKSSSQTSGRAIPDLVINAVSRFDDQDESDQASRTLLGPSISRARNQPHLPSLKSSGLLDVIPDESLGSRSSGASTPVRPHTLWGLSPSGSPRPTLLSPGLLASGASGSSGSAPVSPQSHSPSFHGLHTPQDRLQAPSYYHAYSSQPNPVIVESLETYGKSVPHVSQPEFGSHQGT